MRRKDVKQKFVKEYNALPMEEKLEVAQRHLADIFQYLPQERASKVLSEVSRLRVKSSGIRDLDLKGRKAELNSLFLEIEKDAKCFFLKERSRRDELIEEILSTLNTWMNDIWNLVYVHHVKFLEAHECLMYILEVIDKIMDMPMPPDQRCKCTVMSMPVYLEIRKDSDKTLVKKFALTGVLRLAKPINWLWRELFLSYLAYGGKDASVEIERMVSEIEQKSNWENVERILYGGSGRRDHSNADFPFPSFLGSPDNEDAWTDNDLDTDDEDLEETGDEDEDTDPECAYYMHAPHWNDKIKALREELWDIIESFLLSVFAERPSYGLYLRLTELSYSGIEDELFDILDDIYSDSSDNFAAALRIHTMEDSSDDVARLLKTHTHLLRPRDDSLYQLAVSQCLCEDPAYKKMSLSIIEKELMDTISSVYAKLRFHFPGIEDKRSLEELEKHLKIRPGSSNRKTRIEQWVQQVRYVPQSVDVNGNGGGGPAPNQHPFLLAAMMMGLPPPPGTPGMDEFEDEVSLDMLDQDDFHAREQGFPGDPELADLKEEFRPKLKERFEGWYKVAMDMRSFGQGILFKVYKALVEKMPFFKATDVIEELILVMSPNSSKAYICDALDFLDTFSKTQRKRIKAKAAAAKQAKQPAKPSAAPTVPQSPPSRDSSESPPPLEPITFGGTGATFSSANTAPTPSATTSTPGAGATNATTPTTSSNPLFGGFAFSFGIPPSQPGGLEDVD